MDKRGEITYQSTLIAIIIFGLFLSAGIYVFNESFANYGIEDNNSIEDGYLNNVKTNISDLVKEAEEEDQELSLTDKVLDVATLGVTKILRKVQTVRDIGVNIREALKSAFSFIPGWILISLFAIIFVALLGRGIYAWLKVKP